MELIWEMGTAYDLFASLHVLHNPTHFGLRPKWAAGVRSRFPADVRETLEQADDVVLFPLKWVHSLPDPKDANTALWVLGQMPPAERLPALGLRYQMSDQVYESLMRISTDGYWTEDDADIMQDFFRQRKVPYRKKRIQGILDLWSSPADFGERYLHALQSYYQLFFKDDVQQIRPYLHDALHQGMAMAETKPVDELMETLSQGVRFEVEQDLEELVLAPSYWLTPLIVFERLTENGGILVFGARPADKSLVPGEQVPDAMLKALKTLADPTRLRILRYLTKESLTQAEIARRLRLRPPTITHHLNALRLAGLVFLEIDDDNDRRYEARLETVKNVFESLEGFLSQPDPVTNVTG